MTRTEASVRRTNAQSGILFGLNYVHRCDKDDRKGSAEKEKEHAEKIQQEKEH